MVWIYRLSLLLLSLLFLLNSLLLLLLLMRYIAYVTLDMNMYIYIQRTYAAGIYAHGCFQILIACSLLPGLCLVRSQLPLKSPRTDLFTPLVVPITASGLQGL